MGNLLTKDALLAATDLREEELYLPTLGGSVRVRSLSAAYSNNAVSEASTVENVRGEAIAKFSAAKLEELKVLQGLVDPKLDTVEEARQLSQQVGPAWKLIVEKIDELSGTSSEDVESTNQLFRSSGTSAGRSDEVNGAAGGRAGSDRGVRAGVADGDAGERARTEDEPA
jgi:hypothetical protein